MSENNLKPRLLKTQRMLKKLRGELSTYNRRIMQIAVVAGRLEKEEETLLQLLYDGNIIHIPSKFHDLKKVRLDNMADKLADLSLEELEDVIKYSKTPNG